MSDRGRADCRLLEKSTSSGSSTGRSLSFTAHHAAFRAMDDRDGAAPGTLARHQPVAQAVIHRALAHAGLFQTLGHFGFGLIHRHAVEEARIGEAARARHRPRCRSTKLSASASSGTTTGITGKPVFAGEIQIALVVRGAAENRAGAVTHQHEIGDHHRQLPVGIERMGGGQPGIVAQLFRLSRFRLPPCRVLRHSAMKACELGILRGQFLGQRMIRRQAPRNWRRTACRAAS